MLGEILISLAYGFFKAKLLHIQIADEPMNQKIHDVFVDPLEEEAVFRFAPLTITEDIPHGSTGVAEGALRAYDDGALAGIATGIAGAYYERVYRRHGFLAAWLSHAATNFGVRVGAAPPPPPPSTDTGV